MSLQERNERLFYYVLSEVGSGIAAGLPQALPLGLPTAVRCAAKPKQLRLVRWLRLSHDGQPTPAPPPAPQPPLRDGPPHPADSSQPPMPNPPPVPCSTLRSCCPSCCSPSLGSTARGTASCSAGGLVGPTLRQPAQHRVACSMDEQRLPHRLTLSVACGAQPGDGGSTLGTHLAAACTAAGTQAGSSWSSILA